MITAFQLASLPFWGIGFVFCFIAGCIGLGTGKKEGETQATLMGQCGVGFGMGLPFLIIAAMMWHF